MHLPAHSIERSRARAWFTHIWPIAAGIIFATFVAFGSGPAEQTDIAPIVTASAFVYLGAAALQHRIAAWPLFFVSVVVITIWFRVTGLHSSWSSWALIATAAMPLAYGLIRPGLRPPASIPLQTAAMVVLAAVAIAAMHINTLWAGLLVGAGLLVHTAWDIYHYRTDRVVVRSMALFCAVLDTFLAVVVLVVTLV
jgi:hypothetical protein